jgi:hypothetical protein
MPDCAAFACHIICRRSETARRGCKVPCMVCRWRTRMPAPRNILILHRFNRVAASLCRCARSLDVAAPGEAQAGGCRFPTHGALVHAFLRRQGKVIAARRRSRVRSPSPPPNRNPARFDSCPGLYGFHANGEPVPVWVRPSASNYETETAAAAHACRLRKRPSDLRSIFWRQNRLRWVTVVFRIGTGRRVSGPVEGP